MWSRQTWRRKPCRAPCLKGDWGAKLRFPGANDIGFGDLLVNAIGVVAAVLSITSFIPQVLKIIREHEAASVSPRMYLLTVAGFALWTTYGLLLRSWPLVASNLISLCLSGVILALKFRYGGAPSGDDLD